MKQKKMRALGISRGWRWTRPNMFLIPWLCRPVVSRLQFTAALLPNQLALPCAEK